MHHARTERIANGINAKMRFFLTQTKGRREKERERKRKGKEEEGKEKGKGQREREVGSEALAETEKITNTPAGNPHLSHYLFFQSVRDAQWRP